jgi:hypothetical protein
MIESYGIIGAHDAAVTVSRRLLLDHGEQYIMYNTVCVIHCVQHIVCTIHCVQHIVYSTRYT